MVGLGSDCHTLEPSNSVLSIHVRECEPSEDCIAEVHLSQRRARVNTSACGHHISGVLLRQRNHHQFPPRLPRFLFSCLPFFFSFCFSLVLVLFFSFSSSFYLLFCLHAPEIFSFCLGDHNKCAYVFTTTTTTTTHHEIRVRPLVHRTRHLVEPTKCTSTMFDK